ncbi:hypothetical protein C5167_032912 [Papaver somniferum]|uniref:Uncharacterized protein n=1 Tax=Papaver somniferum TaxID=3469 RepID=A0A4Y7KCW6_PAPSO|nr:hypothetical protein C5167_032912 [Papaver somniferum]
MSLKREKDAVLKGKVLWQRNRNRLEIELQDSGSSSLIKRQNIWEQISYTPINAPWKFAPSNYWKGKKRNAFCYHRHDLVGFLLLSAFG